MAMVWYEALGQLSGVNRVIFIKEEPLLEEMVVRNGKRNEIYMTNAYYQNSRASVYLGKISIIGKW